MSRILIVGLGAIGSNLTTNLVADQKEHEYTLLDHGYVEPRNLQVHTQNYSKEQIDMPKVKAMKINLYNMFNVITTDSYNHISDVWAVVSDEKRYNLIIDCLDNYDGRKIIFDYAEKFDIDCVHVGFSPQFTFEVCWNEFYEVPQDAKGLDICELSGASSFVKYVSALASNVVQDFLRNSNKRNLVGNRFSIREIS